MACSLAHFSVFSQVGNLGCIEFLNRGRMFDSSRGHHQKPQVSGTLLRSPTSGSARMVPHGSRGGHELVQCPTCASGIAHGIISRSTPEQPEPVRDDEQRGAFVQQQPARQQELLGLQTRIHTIDAGR